MPVIILGGIYAGVFTPTESAVVAVVYGLIVCLAVYREISMKTIWEIVENTAEGTANLMILVVTAQMFGWLISYYQIPQAVTNFMLAFVSNKYMFWAIIIILLTICGMFLEVGATNLILGPILAPIAAAFGIDPYSSDLSSYSSSQWDRRHRRSEPVCSLHAESANSPLVRCQSIWFRSL